jgi:hypothetical protein
MNMMTYNPAEWWKTVYVRQYIRFRFGKLEHVIDHYRSRPGTGVSSVGFK